MNILTALSDKRFFGDVFRPKSWDTWKLILASIYGLPIPASTMPLYTTLTGRTVASTAPASEAFIVAGRRGGKSTVAAAVAVFTALSRDWRALLPPGQVATVFVVAPDRAQARAVFRTIKGLISASPLLRQQVIRETESVIELASGVSLEVATCSARTIRGYNCAAVIADELAFWSLASDSAAADENVIAALRPSLATLPGSLLLGISSPYSRSGVLFDEFDKHFSRDGDPIQIFRAPSRLLNPTIPEHVVNEAIERDPVAAKSEWLAEFRSPRDAYISLDVIRRITDKGIVQRPPQKGIRYFGFVDAAGGTGTDSFAAAVAHMQGDVATLDAVFVRNPPFSAESVVAEVAAFLKSYGVTRVRGDHWSGDVIRSMFQRLGGLEYEVSPVRKTAIYRSFLPLASSGRIALLDLPTLQTQLVNLERTVSRTGSEQISHPANGVAAHDDTANSSCGVLVLCSERSMFNTALLYAACDGITASWNSNPALDPGALTSDAGVTLSPWAPPYSEDNRTDGPSERSSWPGV